jgi:hypothetical protein
MTHEGMKKDDEVTGEGNWIFSNNLKHLQGQRKLVFKN